ncbi:MAG: flagellin [Pelagimonas sp.]
MSSVLTNSGAQTALETLRSVNTGLATVQDQIGTGKRVATAQNDAAVWAISKVMQADVAGYKQIQEGLSLAQSTISVGRQGAETVVDLLTDIKGKVVAAQEENVDRGNIQTDIDALRDQINAVVNAASFNGQNLLKHAGQQEGDGQMTVLGSLSRAIEGVTANDVVVARADLTMDSGSVAMGGGVFNAVAGSATLNATQSADIDLSGQTVEGGTVFALSMFGTDFDGSSFAQNDYRTQLTWVPTQFDVALTGLGYVARDGDTLSDVAKGMVDTWQVYAVENDLDPEVLNFEAQGASLKVSSSVTTAMDTLQVRVSTLSASAGSVAAGELAELADLDVTSDAGLRKALVTTEIMLGSAIDAAASLGSDQQRLDQQSKFTSKLVKSMTEGIGRLVDADMEAASAKQKALQVQQQLAVQSLSIANRAPEVVLRLLQ